MKTVFIYALNDPTRQHLGKTRYIGKAVDPYRRYELHLDFNYREKTHKANWIRSLLRVGQTPILEILDEVPEAEWALWEREWIRLYRALGFSLTNATDGGDGVFNPTEATREKMRIAKLGKKRTPEAIAKQRISHSGENHCNFGKKFSEETCEKIGASKRGKILSPEHIQKMSIATSGEKNPFFGKRHSAETRAKISEARRGRVARGH